MILEWDELFSLVCVRSVIVVDVVYCSCKETVCNAIEKKNIRSIDKLRPIGRTCTRLKTGPRSTLAGRNSACSSLCQARLIPCIQMCSGATRSHLHPSHGRDSPRQGSLFYPSVNQHPQAESTGSSCQTTQHLPPHCFATITRPSPGSVPCSPKDSQKKKSSKKHIVVISNMWGHTVAFILLGLLRISLRS